MSAKSEMSTNLELMAERLTASCDRLTRRRAELAGMAAESRNRRDELRASRLLLQQRRAQLRAEFDLMRVAPNRAAAAILEAAWRVLGCSIEPLWFDYFALGGYATREELSQMLAGEMAISCRDHDLIAHAINERLNDAGLRHLLAYWDGSR